METTTLVIQIVFWGTLGLLAYTYLVYPFLAVCIGSGRVENVLDELPPISVLVPAHNEAAVIAQKIHNVRSLDYPQDRLELIIADDGSVDGTYEAAKKAATGNVKLIRNAQRVGKAESMNRLVAEASHDLLLFTDANVEMAPNVVRRLVDPLGSPCVGAVTGEVRLIGSDAEFGIGEALYYWLERRIQGAESRIGSVMGVDGGMYLIRRCLFSQIPPDTILDDFYVSVAVMRARCRVVYENAAKATESGTPSAREEFSRRTRIAAGAVQLIRRRFVPHLTQPVLWAQFLSHKVLRWLSPVLLVTLFVTNALLWQQGQVFRIMMAAQLVTHSVIGITWVFPPIRRTKLGGVLFYFGLSQVAMAIGLLRGGLNRQSTQWSKAPRQKHAEQSG